MKVFFGVLAMCLMSVAYSQILRPGNIPEESGAPIYEEITVESVLTVRGKSGSRTGKSSSDLSKQARRNSSDIGDGADVGRRTRSAELSEGYADSVINNIPVVAASDANSVHRIIRPIRPKISLELP